MSENFPLAQEKLFENEAESVPEYLRSDRIEPKILIDDVFVALDEMPDECVDVVVTSPPYWRQRDYGITEQIGQEIDPGGYIKKIVHVGEKLLRVVKPRGAFYLNIGDKYVKKNLQMIPSRVCLGLQETGWVLRNFIVWHKPNHMPSGFEDRFTSTWEPIFFFVKGTGTYLPPRYHFNLDPLRVSHKTEQKQTHLPLTLSEEEYLQMKDELEEGNEHYSGKFKGHEKNRGASPGARMSLYGEYYTKERIHKPDVLEVINYLRDWRKKAGLSIEEIDKALGYKHTAGHWFRTDEGGRSLPRPDDWKRLKGILRFDDKYEDVMTEEHYVLRTVRAHPKGKNPGDVWRMTTGNLQDVHFAIFPEELPRRAIQASCLKGGVVLDPFAGSGTTGKVAMELKRKSILIEINPEYERIIRETCSKS